MELFLTRHIHPSLESFVWRFYFDNELTLSGRYFCHRLVLDDWLTDRMGRNGEILR